jgi:trigger factor
MTETNIDTPPTPETKRAGETAEKLNPIVQIEDAGPCRKKVSVEVSKDAVEGRLKKLFDEFRKDNVLPGFRRGRAPRRLIEKRVGKELRDQLKAQLVMEALQEPEELKNLRAIGEPDLKLEQIALNDGEALKFTFVTEVRPTFALPEYKGLKLLQHKYEIGEAEIEDALLNLRKRYGALEPVEDGKVEKDDQLSVDIDISAEGKEILTGEDQTLSVEPTRLNDLPMEDLPERLAGAAIGETREWDLVVHGAFPAEEFRGKTARVKVNVKGIKRVAPASVEDTLKAIGASTLDELKSMILDGLERDAERAKAAELRNQVCNHLLKNTKLDLPPELVGRYAARLLRRKAVQLMQEGVPPEEVQSHAGEISQEAVGEAATDLSLSYILEDIAEKEQIEISNEELNNEIAALARMYDRRFDAMREELARTGRLEELYVRLREKRTVDRIIESAQIEQLDHAAGPGHTHEHGQSHEQGQPQEQGQSH